MSSLFQTFLVEPLYNALIFIINHLPFADLGFAVIILTIIVRFALYPISRNAIQSQIKMREIQPKLRELQEKHKDDRQKLAMEMMELYRSNNVKPFSSFLLILIQLPIIFALYFVFLREGLPEINPELLYSFINTPVSIETLFLGAIDLTGKSIILAFAAAFSQFIQAHIMIAKTNSMTDAHSENLDPNSKEKMMQDMMKGMQVQMKYVMPIFMYFISYSLGAVIALYFTISNLFSIFQELYIKKNYLDKPQA